MAIFLLSRLVINLISWRKLNRSAMLLGTRQDRQALSTRIPRYSGGHWRVCKLELRRSSNFETFILIVWFSCQQYTTPVAFPLGCCSIKLLDLFAKHKHAESISHHSTECRNHYIGQDWKPEDNTYLLGPWIVQDKQSQYNSLSFPKLFGSSKTIDNMVSHEIFWVGIQKSIQTQTHFPLGVPICTWWSCSASVCPTADLEMMEFEFPSF